MATITIRLDDTTRTQLAELAAAQDRTLSDLIRTTLEFLVEYPETGGQGAGRYGESVAPRSLSPYERDMLALQHRILAHVMPATHEQLREVDPDAAEVEGDPQCQRERARVLERGYVTEYDDVFISINPELSAEDCRFVRDVLDLFQQTRWEIDRLRGAGTEVDPDVVRRLTFHGFDFNDSREGALCDYARHLVSESRWAQLLECFDNNHEHGNSHAPMSAVYERLVQERRAIIKERPGYGMDRYRLDVKDLKRIADAAIHPSSR